VVAVRVFPAKVYGEVIAGDEVKSAGVAVGGLECKRGYRSRGIRANTASYMVLSRSHL